MILPSCLQFSISFHGLALSSDRLHSPWRCGPSLGHCHLAVGRGSEVGGENGNRKNGSEKICVVSWEARLLFHTGTPEFTERIRAAAARDVSHLLLLPAPSPLQVLATRQPSDLNMKPTEERRRRCLPLPLPSSHRLLRVCLCEDPAISWTDSVSEAPTMLAQVHRLQSLGWI